MKQIYFNHLYSVLTFNLLLFTCLLSGCGYTIQTRSNLPFETIAIGTIENKTHEPKLEDRLQLALAQNFLQYGFSISPHARYRIEGEIYDFVLLPTTEVNLAATQYQVVIKVNFKLVDTESGKSLHLPADSPFITYFGSSGRLEAIMAQKELAEDGALSNMSQTLVSLVTYTAPRNFAWMLFKPDDIKNAEGFILKLREAKDPLSQYLREQFSAGVLRKIDAYSPFDYSLKELRPAMANELNNLIQNRDLYDEKRFAGTKLSDEALRLISRSSEGFNRVRLNRILLEEAYPDELAKAKP